MGQIKDAMIDFCELAVQGINDANSRDSKFESVMDRLIDGDPELENAFVSFLQVRRIITRINGAAGVQRLRWATKLWNAIDCMARPEAAWNLMAREIPDVFYDRSSVNCMKFTY